MRHPISLTLATAALLLPSSLFAADQMRDGLWEITTRMEMPQGMPAGMPAMQPMTQRQCITKKDLQERKNTVPHDSRCQVTDIKTVGSKTTWKVRCPGPDAASGSGEITYRGDGYQGVMRMNADGMGPMVMHYSGKRIGDCR
jgi:hypothetical protein